MKYGKLCGIPPAMGGVVDGEATRADLENLENCVIEVMRECFGWCSSETRVLKVCSEVVQSGLDLLGRCGVHGIDCLIFVAFARCMLIAPRCW